MLSEKIYSDYVSALKAKEKDKAAFLNFLRGQLKNLSIELKQDPLEDGEALKVIAKIKKQLEDNKGNLEKSGRIDLIDKNNDEITVLAGYLPEQMPKEELVGLINGVIALLGASSMRDMGAVMKEVLAKVGAAADNKTVSSLVKEKLSS